MADGQLIKRGKHEPNPFRPDLPENLRELSGSLYDFLRETIETLRAQHNLTQAGDSTFSWEILTEVDLLPRYNLGSLGRFYHEKYGVTHARYCKLWMTDEQIPLGSPVGFKVSGGYSPWVVTDMLAKSNSALYVGLGAWFARPPLGAYGWVIQSGVNLQPAVVESGNLPTRFSKLVWKDSGLLGIGAEISGENLGLILANEQELESVPEGWAIPAGGLLAQHGADSEARIKGWITAQTSGLGASISSLQASLTQLQGLGGVAGLQGQVAALETRLALLEALVGQNSVTNLQNLALYHERILALETAVF